MCIVCGEIIAVLKVHKTALQKVDNFENLVARKLVETCNLLSLSNGLD